MIKIKANSLKTILDSNVIRFGESLKPYLSLHNANKVDKFISRGDNLAKKLNSPSPRDKRGQKLKTPFKFSIGMSFFYLLSFCIIGIAFYYTLGFDLGLHNNVITAANNAFAIPYKLQIISTKILALSINQISPHRINAIIDTPDSILNEIASLSIKIDLTIDRLGYSSNLIAFFKKLIGYNLCQLYFLEEWIQIKNICLIYFPNINYTGGIAMSTQMNTAATTGPNSILDIPFPDPTESWSKSEHTISIDTLITSIKNMMITRVVNIKNEELTKIPRNQTEFDNFLKETMNIFNYNYSTMDFFHHIVVR